jgi:hypothetical protein
VRDRRETEVWREKEHTKEASSKNPPKAILGPRVRKLDSTENPIGAPQIQMVVWESRLDHIHPIREDEVVPGA